jgi:hypothetical protein
MRFAGKPAARRELELAQTASSNSIDQNRTAETCTMNAKMSERSRRNIAVFFVPFE